VSESDQEHMSMQEAGAERLGGVEPDTKSDPTASERRWTRDKPTQPGWYWWRIEGSMEPTHCCVVHVSTRGQRWYVEGLDKTEIHMGSDPYDGGEWQGPITPHEDPT
jgi:hypothetical protein